MRETLVDYCLRYGSEALLSQWHPTRNGTLRPEEISFGSQKPVWWRCDEGHEWQSPPGSRTGKGSGCPYCAGKRVLPGSDLRALYPELAAQWHPTRNGRRKPEQLLPGSSVQAWWRCGRGHEWKAAVKTRVRGSGCPVCANRIVVPGQNDLKSSAPLLAAQWHPTRNGALMPDRVSCGSTRRVWWQCSRGHEWQAEVASRTRGRGCPVCTGKTVVPGENDLSSYDPGLARQWLQEKNGMLTPDQVSAYSNRRVWWRCDRGHQWRSTVAARTANRTGCPYCSGRVALPGFNDLQTVAPLVAAQWHPTRNGALTPQQVTAGCSKKVWWRCSDGHEWRAVVYSRTGTQKCGCPVCAGRAPRAYE